MGQKVNPNGFRVGVIRDWNTRWYASKKDFADFLVEDRKIRDFVKKKYYQASISRIEIDRAAGKTTVSIFTARPGLLIGKGGTGIDAIKDDIKKAIGKDVIAAFATDPAILGGTVIAIGDRVYDGSVRKRLGRLRAQLLSR